MTETLELRFDPDVQGHTRIKDALGRMLASQQLHPSLIFSGPVGVGKRRMALDFARALNCPSGGAVKPCFTCSSCRKLSSANHPDVQIIEALDGKRAVSIAQIRAMIEDMGLKPYEGKHRVFILEDADRLAVDAQNTLLKTLEEPPGATVTILLTSRPHSLIPTIHSRCQRHRFTALSQQDLERVFEQQGIPIERASFAGGCPGRALNDDMQARAEEARLLLEAIADGRARRDPMGLALELLKTLEKGAKGPETRRRLEDLCDFLARAFRDILHQRVTGAPPEEALAPFAADCLPRLAQRWDSRALRKSLAALEKLQLGMTLNLQVKLAVEGLIVDLMTA